MFKHQDIVKYDTGTTYMVSDQRNETTLAVVGWKNGKPFGAYRLINPARCTLIGRAIRPKTSADSWQFEPTA